MNKGGCPMITQNESTIDRIIRVVVGLFALVIGATMLTGLPQTIAYGIGGVGIVTGIIGYCGLYALLGISTKKRS